jgi:sulfide:quinone oxidoreductase
MKDSYQVLIVGGGSAGLSVAAQLLLADPDLDIGIVEPSDKHYYQPIWTLVGAGVFPKEISEKSEEDFIPRGADWIRDRVASVDPDADRVTLESGRAIAYEYLVMAPGIQLDWDRIDGLPGTLGKNGVVSNYGYDRAPQTWDVLRHLNGGRAVFTSPNTPLKCGGAPQKIMYLAADHLRLKGALDRTEVLFMNPGTTVFGVEYFAKTLRKVIARYGIDFNLYTELVAVQGPEQKATFRVTNPDDGTTTERTVEFDMLHVVPPQSAPDFVKKSPLANADGWVDVNRETLQHVRHANVFGLGDAAGTPNAKTGAAVRKQAPVVSANLLQQMRQGSLTAPKRYDGYSSCPLVTGYGKLVLAEFDFDNRPLPSFPFDTSQERYSMYALKVYVLPDLYWHGMLKGRA